ncbi:hypothetical protein Baya_12165 [Bagarius yarrelli]|uniref:Uncharacterized protein n=1 Tax=Bagarius yarrelli TaxID=175774 RepID=A0A556V210_BAGYA|nr:hypothetical protein Baya_12165 [Bagarius yarrelli]
MNNLKEQTAFGSWQRLRDHAAVGGGEVVQEDVVELTDLYSLIFFNKMTNPSLDLADVLSDCLYHLDRDSVALGLVLGGGKWSGGHGNGSLRAAKRWNLIGPNVYLHNIREQQGRTNALAFDRMRKCFYSNRSYTRINAGRCAVHQRGTFSRTRNKERERIK